MLTWEQARALVASELEEMGRTSFQDPGFLAILDEHTIEKDWGWVLRRPLIGEAPILGNGWAG